MNNILDTLAEKLESQAKSDNGIKGLQKDDIDEILKSNITAHEAISEIEDGMTNKETKEWFRDTVTITLKQSKSVLKDIVTDFCSELNGKSLVFERDRPLSSLGEANREYAKLLKEISKNLDKIMDDGFIEIYNSRLSTISLLGIIADSDNLINFTTYLYTFLVRCSVGDEESIPRYRTQFLMEYGSCSK